MELNNLQADSDDPPVLDDVFEAKGRPPRSKAFSKGSILFIEGDAAAGVYLLRTGRAKLTTMSSAGRATIVGIAGPGDMLGLAACMRGTEYEGTAEALERCVVEFVPRSVLLRHLGHSSSAALQAVEQLSRDYLAAQKVLATLVTAEPVLIRLARLLLSWAPSGNGGGPIRVSNEFTHQQLAEMIGTTRETVTRSLRELREREVVTLKGRDLVIHHHEKLRLMTANGCDLAHRHETPT
jgi:CRP/FNR family transcriptional regulator, cyclic AMP receptor protein